MNRLLLIALALLFLLPDARAQAPAIRPPARPVVPPALTPGYNPNTPPDPVYTPPGTGLPEVGQPGTHAAPVKRSPNTRALPDEFDPKKEPGFWAADGATRATADTMPPIFDVPFPYPHSTTSPAERWWSDMCAKTMTHTAKNIGMDAEFAKLPLFKRQCLAARAYLYCANGILDALRGMAKARPNTRAAEATQRHATALVKYNCVHGDVMAPHEKPLRDLFEKWDEGLPDALSSMPTP
jgi:hypothetical protein